MTQSMSSRPALIATPEASPKYDDSYMGYSIAVGDFAGQGIQSVAVGVPRGASLKGLVRKLYCIEKLSFLNYPLHITYTNLYYFC